MQSLFKQFKQLVFKPYRLRPTQKRITVCLCNLHAITQFGRNTGAKTALAAALLASAALFSTYSWATDPVLATQPLGASGGLVKPNLMFILDASGSMAEHNSSAALAPGSRMQCKAAILHRKPNISGEWFPITNIKRGTSEETNTVLTITAPKNNTSAYRLVKGDVAQLAVPGNPNFSGVYTITSNTANCLNKSSEITVREPVKYGEWAYQPANPALDKAEVLGCIVATSKPANNTDPATRYSNKNQHGGKYSNATGSTGVDNPNCYWLDYADYPTGEYCNGAQNQGYDGLTMTVANAFTSGTFTAAQIKDASMLLKAPEIDYCSDSSDAPGGGTSVQIGASPPHLAAAVQPLFYDPKVNYVPPPKPTFIGQGLASPANQLKSMTSANTDHWNKVYENGLKLTGGEQDSSTTPQFAPTGEVQGFSDNVYCDTPNMPTDSNDDPAYNSERTWLESSRCMKNTAANNKSTDANVSPRYPYLYPTKTDGLGSTGPSKTLIFDGNISHQYGVAARPNTAAPAADLYAYGKYYNYAAPYYYNIRPIEWCDSPALTTCLLTSTLAATPNATYKFPAYVRYCKTETPATDTSISPAAGACQGIFTGDSNTNTVTDYQYARYGMFDRIDVVSTVNSYAKSADRTDCVGATCTYEEEMTNMANWYAYYRTRLQMMKSVAGRTFEKLDDKIRVGLITVDGYNTVPGNYLAIKDFDNAQKQLWLERLYSRTASGETPLRQVLSKVGQIYAGKKPITGFTAAVDDPMQFSCQQNFTLLTTDGYWNQAAGTQIDGVTAIGDQDGGATPRPRNQGNTTSNTLADVAEYYYDTDLRTSALGNCSPGGVSDVCANNVPEHDQEDVSAKQHMTTFTLGLGVNGNLNYTTDYKTAPTGDFASLKNPVGTLTWPAPATNGDDGHAPLTNDERATVDDLWHAAVNGRGT
ncbi:MAG: hypothetical protein WCG35_10075, partial [Betaproteobacteria bacterium]